jgi:hypothetical protein
MSGNLSASYYVTIVLSSFIFQVEYQYDVMDHHILIGMIVYVLADFSKESKDSQPRELHWERKKRLRREGNLQAVA